MRFSKKTRIIKNVLLAMLTLMLTIGFAACTMNAKEPKPLPRVAENENVKIEGLSDGFLITIKAVRHGGGEIEIDGCPIVIDIYDYQTSYHCPFGQKDKKTKFTIRCDYDPNGDDHWEFKEDVLSCASDGGYLWTDLVDLTKFTEDNIKVNGSYNSADGIFKGYLSTKNKITSTDFIKNSNLVTEAMCNFEVIMGAVDRQEPNHFDPESEGLFRTDNYGNWCFSVSSNDENEKQFLADAQKSPGIELNNRRIDFESPEQEIHYDTPDKWTWYDHGLQYAMRAELRFKIKGYDTNDWPVFKTKGLWSQQYYNKTLQPEHFTAATDNDGIKITLNDYWGEYPEANIRVEDCPVTLRYNPEDREYYSDPTTKAKKFIFTEKDKTYLVVADIKIDDGTNHDWVREAVFCKAGGGKKFEDCINLDIEKYYNSIINVEPIVNNANGRTYFNYNLDTGLNFDENMIKDEQQILNIEFQYEVVLGNRRWEPEDGFNSDVYGNIYKLLTDFVDDSFRTNKAIDELVKNPDKIERRGGFPEGFNWNNYGKRYAASFRLKFWTKGSTVQNPPQYELEPVWSGQYFK